LAALGPEPVTIGKWLQPASLTAVQQDRPSVTTLLPAASSRLTSVALPVAIAGQEVMLILAIVVIGLVLATVPAALT
jgi:hypothetical protein